MSYLLPEYSLTRLDTVHHCDALTLLRALPDQSVSLIATDPPYGCGTQVSAWRSPDERFKEIAGVDQINPHWLTEAYRVIAYSGALYCFAKWVNFADWMKYISAAGFTVRNCLVWDKLQHGTGNLSGAYGPQHEFILFATKGIHNLRGKRPVDILRYKKVQPDKLSHPYEKPIDLLKFLILKFLFET